MKVNLSIQATLDVSSNQFVVALYAASAPTVLLQTVIPSKPYGDPIQIEFDGLTYGVAYIVKLWESTDGTASGIVRNSGTFTALSNTIALRADLVLMAGRDTGIDIGGTKYTDPSNSLAGWYYSLENRGTGTMIAPPDANAEYSLDSYNNFTLTDGETFQAGQVFILHFFPQSAQTAPPQPALISSGVTLTANTSLDNSYKNKAIYLQGASAYFAATLPPLSTMTDYDVMYFYSAGGSHINVGIVASGSDLIQRNGTVASVVLGQNEQLKLFKANSKWQVDYCSIGVDEVGRKFASDFPNELNALLANGQTVSRTTYARLWAKISGSAQLIAQSIWGNQDGSGNYINKAFFGNGDGSTTFTLPDLTAYGFRKAVGASPGTFQQQDVMQHAHLNGMGVNSDVLFPYGGTTTDMPGASTSNVAGNGGHGSRQGKTSKSYKVDFSALTSETRPNNTGEYIYIRI